MCFMETYVFTADVMVVTEDAYGEQRERIHGPNSDLSSNTPNSEHREPIVLDSFKYGQCKDLKTNKTILSSDIAEAGRASFKKEQHPGCDLPSGSSMCHTSELDCKDSPQDGDVCIPESILHDMSPKDRIISERRNGACSDLKENPVHVGFNSMEKDLPTAQDFTEGIMCYDIWHGLKKF